MTRNDLRLKNGRLRDQIARVVEKIQIFRTRRRASLRQDLHVAVGAPFLERTHSKLQERAEAIIKRHPGLEHNFDTKTLNASRYASTCGRGKAIYGAGRFSRIVVAFLRCSSLASLLFAAKSYQRRAFVKSF